MDIDFQRLYNTNDGIINTFNDISGKLILLLDQRIKDVGSKKILETLKNTPDISDSMYYIFLYKLILFIVFIYLLSRYLYSCRLMYSYINIYIQLGRYSVSY